MLVVVLFLWGLCADVHGAYEDYKQEIFTVEHTGKWKGKANSHVPILDLISVKGGGWVATMSTTHGKQDNHYIAKHWVEDGDGSVIASSEFSSTDNNPLNEHQNQTTAFNVPKGTKEPLTTYAWCNLHGTWAHTWDDVKLWHFDDDVKFDENGNEVQEKVEETAEEKSHLKQPSDIPQNAKVSSEDLKEFKKKIYTAEEPGHWRGKASSHTPSLDLHPVKGGGWIADVETNHGKDPSHFISKHWIEDGGGTIIGVVDFDMNDSENNSAKRQLSQFHIPKEAVEPLTTYALCNVHGTWAHVWDTLSLEHGATEDITGEIVKDEL